MNPTINADALAHFMRGLFRDEITEEHALVASMKAVDVAPFQHELDQATHKHTVTFARASGINRIISRSAQPSGSIKIPTSEQLLAHPHAARPVHRRHAGGARRRRGDGDAAGAAGARGDDGHVDADDDGAGAERQAGDAAADAGGDAARFTAVGRGGAADADARRPAAAARGAPARQGEQGGVDAEGGRRRRTTRSSATRRIRCRRSSAP